MRWKRQIAETALAVRAEGGGLVAGALDGGEIHVLDSAAANATLRSISTGKWLKALRVLEWRGNTLAFATVKGRLGWEVRIWNLGTGEEVPTNHAYKLRYGQQDKWMHSLAVSPNAETIRIAFASKYGQVMIADFDGDTPKPLDKVDRCFQVWPVPNAGEGYIKSLASCSESSELLLAAGTEGGHLAIWNFLNGTVKSARPDAHLGKVSVLSFHCIQEQTVLVSSGDDGVVRLWTTGLRELFTVEIGEAVSDVAWVGNDRLAVGTGRGVLMVQFDEENLAALLHYQNGLGAA